MNAISARREGDIEPVVDEHACAGGPRGVDGGTREVAQPPGGEVSFANLNQLAAGLRRLADGRELFAPLSLIREVRIAAERSAVGDQVE